MVAAFLIMLREGLEAALVVSILLAYLTKAGRRDLVPSVWTGVALAVFASLALGAVLTFGPTQLSDEAAETLTGALSLVAVGFVTWMIFWMAGAGRRLAGDLRAKVDAAIDANRWGLPLVAFFAVAREGLESTLFLWANARSAGADATALIGALLGLALAVAIAWGIYRGSLTLNVQKFFTWTSWFLVVVAAGVLAYAVHEFQEAGVLPGEDDLAFNLTGVIAKDNPVAVLVRGIFNLRPAMAWLEISAWLAYAVIVGALFWWRTRRVDAERLGVPVEDAESNERTPSATSR